MFILRKQSNILSYKDISKNFTDYLKFHKNLKQPITLQYKKHY